MVDLYYPPVPDQNALVKVVMSMVEHLNEFASAINRRIIDIDDVDQRYIDFDESVHQKK